MPATIHDVAKLAGVGIGTVSSVLNNSRPVNETTRQRVLAAVEKLDFVPKTNLIMTWGGLRGGISIALALSLAPHMERDLFLMITYLVVIFSIVVQGLTVGKLVKKLNRLSGT